MARTKARIIGLKGDWDISRRDELERLLEPAYAWPAGVVIDMSGVDYADSTILAALVVLRNRRRSKKLPLPALVVASRQVRRLLSISGLDEAFACYETVEAATADS